MQETRGGEIPHRLLDIVALSWVLRCLAHLPSQLRDGELGWVEREDLGEQGELNGLILARGEREAFTGALGQLP